MYVVKRGDTRQALEGVLVKDEYGNPVDLTGATVRFYMRSQYGGANKVNGAIATIADAVNGRVWHVWQPADVDTAGVFFAEFKVTFADGKRESYPNGSFIGVDIREGFA